MAIKIPSNVVRENIIKRQAASLDSSLLPKLEHLPPTRTYLQAKFQQYVFTGNLYIPADDKRIYLLIQNTGATTMFIDFTGVVGITSQGLQLPGSVFAYYEPLSAPISAVNITGDGNALVGTL